MSAFVRAALRLLFHWAERTSRRQWPRALRCESMELVVAEAEVDRFGNAIGGVPSPFLDAPIACYEAHSTPGTAVQLLAERRRCPTRCSSAGQSPSSPLARRASKWVIRGGPRRRNPAGRRALGLRRIGRSDRDRSTDMTVNERARAGQPRTGAVRGGSPRCNSGFGCRILVVVPGPVVDRISTNARFIIQCADAAPDELAPALCVKGYFNEIGRAARHVAHRKPASTETSPRDRGTHMVKSVYADIDPASRHGVIITEDVVAQGGNVPRQAARYTGPGCRSSRQLAAFMPQRGTTRLGRLPSG